ncbi:4-hydroxyphenyl-beta-ketoacyl-CoA hydrolase [Subtercola boreus]|uniref:4-hydroxyphenyl-beta-ketoacyl-CoA hydrolase n=1 Tax=Subtercola boreus TaxID=120213 RepID=A0A3E0VHA4_9MICO|nr:amidohydrolase family protein [Subtercola boreus]RFA09101.1 4-hydroxyphenyl-beta-ketoacyl-CoA hydrolase [Subtercola boreus]TQL53892.1 hypothetical protein FB464_1411 [Subtercola boreus]
MYSSAIDLDTIEAIDTHVHIEVAEDGHSALPADLAEAAAKYFRTDGMVPTLDAIADYYRVRRMAAVVFTVDAEQNLSHPPISSVEVIEGAARNNDVLIPFGSVDPNRADAVGIAEELVTGHGARGFKFHPTMQGFDPSDERFFPLWAAIEQLGVPALFHTGQTGIGAGTPGGRGLRLALSNPMLLDVVAATFPALSIIMAHPSVPWQDEAISVATHKSNVYIDLSGWSPKYFPAQLVRAANSLLKEKVLFGSDFPLISPDRWLADFSELDLKAEVRPLITKQNAVRLLGLRSTHE